MRKRLAIATGLVAVMLAIVGPPFVALSVRPYGPPLRVGMHEVEVDKALKPLGFERFVSILSGEIPGGSIYYYPEDVEYGNSPLIRVHYTDEVVDGWEVISRTHNLPPWLDKALIRIGLVSDDEVQIR